MATAGIHNIPATAAAQIGVLFLQTTLALKLAFIWAVLHFSCKTLHAYLLESAHAKTRTYAYSYVLAATINVCAVLRSVLMTQRHSPNVCAVLRSVLMTHRHSPSRT